MANAYPAPDPIQSTFLIPGTNTPGTGVQVFFYLNGTNTKQNVFKDNSASTAWTNPIVLDSGGNLPGAGEVYILSGQTAKVVYAPSNDTDPPASPYRTLNDIQGINDPQAGSTSGVAVFGEWTSPATPIFVGPSTFVFTGDYTGDGFADVGRRIKAQISAGTVYGYIHDRSFSAGTTTINIVPDIGQQLDAGLTTLFWGILSAKNASMPYGVSRGWEVPVNVASSTPIYTSGISENILLTSTAATITSFDGGYPGMIRFVRASSGGFTIQHNATSIICPTGSSIAVAQNDHFTALALTSSITFIKTYSRFSGAQLGTIASPTLLTVTTYANTSATSITIGFSGSPYNTYTDILVKCRGFMTQSTGEFSQRRVIGNVSQTNGADFITGNINSFWWEANPYIITSPSGAGGSLLQQVTTLAFFSVSPFNVSVTTGLASSALGGLDVDFQVINFRDSSSNTFMPKMTWEGTMIAATSNVMPLARFRGLLGFTSSTTGQPATTGQLNAIRLQVSTDISSMQPFTIRRVEIWGV